jgi:hypothetical protein
LIRQALDGAERPSLGVPQTPTLKAYRAYIAGLGTTGVLIGSFLLLLAVVSTIVAFRGAPGEASNDGLGRLDMSDSRQASKVGGAPGAAGDAARDRAARGGRDAARGSKRRGRFAGGAGGAGALRGERVAGGVAGGVPGSGAGGPGGGAGSASGPGGVVRRLPVDPRNVGNSPSSPSLGDVTSGVGDAVEQTSGDLGGAVGNALPPLERPIVRTGETAAGILQDSAPAVDQTVERVGGVAEQVTGAADQVTGVADQVTGGGLGLGGGN